MLLPLLTRRSLESTVGVSSPRRGCAWSWTGLLATAIALAFVAWTAIEGGPSHAEVTDDCKRRFPATTPSGMVRSIDPRVCRALRLARRPRRAGDVPPVAGREWVVAQGINPSLARRARRVGARGIYLLTGRRNSCLYFGLQYGGFVCKSHRRVAQGKLHIIEMDRRRFTLVQILPDRSSDISLVIRGKRRQRLIMRGNAIVARGHERKATGHVEWRDAVGKRHREPFVVELP